VAADAETGDLAAALGMAPREAVEFLRGKGYRTTFAWQDAWQRDHDAAFTVAKMLDVDLLRDVRDAVDKALAEGQTLAQFRTGLEPTLQRAGWWGRKAMTDPATGEIREVQLGSPRRLETIFRVNMQAAYAAGQWQQIQDAKADFEYLMYDAVDDGRTRDEHAAWDGTVLRADDPWWLTHYPPNGWNCRCSVVQLSREQLEDMGIEPASKAPESPTRSYRNPRTGITEQVPEGIDPGWAYAPGASRAAQLQQQLQGKLRDWREGQ
jgi:SPP1 gp7 family putative phage head morphogenesis protein